MCYLVLIVVLLASFSSEPSANIVQTAIAETLLAQQKQVSSPAASIETPTPITPSWDIPK